MIALISLTSSTILVAKIYILPTFEKGLKAISPLISLVAQKFFIHSTALS